MGDNIILIGFMGTGKDAVGKALAQKTGKVFLSTDKMIELYTGMKIKDLFASHGQAYFRLKEKEILRSIRYLKNLVVATGGGIVLKTQNQQTLLAMGKVVGLSAHPQIITTRLAHKADRPLLKSKHDIIRLLKKRQGKYDFADITFDTSCQDVGSIARKIKQTWHLKKDTLPNITKTVKIKTKNKIYSVVISVGLLHKKQKLKQLTNLGVVLLSRTKNLLRLLSMLLRFMIFYWLGI
jgi:shikimate kinase